MTPEQRRRQIQLLQMQERARATEAPAQSERSWLARNIIGGSQPGQETPGELLGSWLNRGGESMTLGLLGDEFNAATYGMLPGRTYEGELARMRQNEDSLGTWGRLSADLVGGVAPALLGVGAVSAAPTLAGAVGRGAALGGGAGAVQGFMEGEGGGTSRLVSGLAGGTVGAGLGAAIPAVGAAGRHAWRSVDTARRNARVGQSIGADLGISPEAGQALGRIVGGGDDAAMRAALQQSGPSGMLADASPATVGMLDAAVNSPVPGAQLARQRVNARAASSQDAVLDALMGGQQGPRMPPVAAQRAMGDAARGRINPLYQRAYNKPIDYSSEAGQAIEEIVNRLPPRHAAQAIQRATDRMIYDGVPNAQIMATIADDGSVAFRQMPNVMQLDYIKRAFDEIASDSKDAITGRMTSDGAFASRIARDIREATKRAVPEYGDALAAAASDIRQRGAVQTGQRLIQPNTTVEDALEAIGDATPAEIRAMREGVMGQIDHILGNVRAVASDRNIDARQAYAAYGNLSSPNVQRKLAALYGDDWPALKSALDEAGAAIGLRADTAVRSPTTPRLAANALVDEVTEPGMLQSLRPIASARELGQQVLGSDPASIARLRDEVRGELAEVLTRPGEGQAALDAISRALLASPINTRAGDAVARALMLGGATLAPRAASGSGEVISQLLTGR